MNYEAPDAELVSLAGEVSIADLLMNCYTQDLAIRFLSSIRKALLDVPSEDIQRISHLSALIYKLNELITKERRDAAFDNGRIPPAERKALQR